MPIDAVKIPQNVYIEDRIVGPLTLRQIVIVGIGTGISYALYSSLSKAAGGVNIVVTILVWIPAAFSVILAFFKLNDLSLFQIALLSFERFNKASVRTWQPRRGISVNIRTFTEEDDKKARKNQDMPKKETSGIDHLSSALDAMNPMNEPLPDETETAPPQPAPAPRPVNPAAVSAEPLADGAPLDGIAPRVSVSIFKTTSVEADVAGRA